MSNRITDCPCCPELHLHRDGTTVGILRHGHAALLINAGNPSLANDLRDAGIEHIDMVLFTHHRRELADGLSELLQQHRPQIHVPRAEAGLFSDPDSYWDAPNSRWYALCNRVPYHVTHIRPIEPLTTVGHGDTLSWHDWEIAVHETPGYTDGSVSYVVRRGDVVVAFTGDLIYGPGQVRDLYCLQRGNERNGHAVGDYHGFMGSVPELMRSLERIRELEPTALVPAHGKLMDKPNDAIDLLCARLRDVYQNYVEVSALRWYFPDYFASHSATPGTLPMQETVPLPPNVRRVKGNVWLLVATNGRALMTDPYAVDAVDDVQALLDRGEITAVDGIWITHYHCDHVEAAEYARKKFACPLITDRTMADIVVNPSAYFLTCLANTPAKVTRATDHGETWRWHDFTLSAYHFPGQTYYHSGLLAVHDSGARYFLAGDSFTPTGIDDYCSWNRNFLADGAGFRQCVRLLQQLKPHIVFNQHVEVGFRFTDEALELILANLDERKRLMQRLLPWPNPNFGTDEYWIHTYPYEQTVPAGQNATIQVRVLNHASQPEQVRIDLLPVSDWTVHPAHYTTVCPAKMQTSVTFDVQTCAATPPGRYVLPVKVTFGGQDLGSCREALVQLVSAEDTP